MPVGDPHRENWPALQALSALVSRSRAMPVGDRRSKRCRRWFRAPARCRSETGAPSVVGAGFALPRDAGQRPALQALSALVSRSRAMPVGDRRSKRCRRWFRAPARCRSETGAPSVVGAGFALPRDAGRRPALQALSALVSRSRAMPVGDRHSKRCRRWFRAPARCRETGAPSVVGAGFALPRDAGRRPALQALSALVSRSRAMPVRDRRSKRCRRWFRAPARCRSETGTPALRVMVIPGVVLGIPCADRSPIWIQVSLEHGIIDVDSSIT